MAQPARYGRNTRAYRRKAKATVAANPVCWICGHLIDPDLPYHHRMAGTSDHVDPLATGGHVLGEQRAAHRACNSSRGDGTRRSTVIDTTPRSSAW